MNNANAKMRHRTALPFRPRRGSSFHENDRLSTVAAEHFKSLSRHSSPTEDREGRQPSPWRRHEGRDALTVLVSFPRALVSEGGPERRRTAKLGAADLHQSVKG